LQTTHYGQTESAHGYNIYETLQTTTTTYAPEPVGTYPTPQTVGTYPPPQTVGTYPPPVYATTQGYFVR